MCRCAFTYRLNIRHKHGTQRIGPMIQTRYTSFLPTTGLRDLRKGFPKATFLPRAYLGPHHLSLQGAEKVDLVASSSRCLKCDSGKAERRALATIQRPDARDCSGVITSFVIGLQRSCPIVLGVGKAQHHLCL